MFLIFTLSDFCVPIKHGLLNVFPFKADMNWFYLSNFYSILTFFSLSLLLWLFHYYCCCFFVIVIAIIISLFSMLVSFISLVFIILFFIFVYIKCFQTLNVWRGRTLFKVFWDCISVFDVTFEQCLFSLFFWRRSFKATLLYFALDNYFSDSLSSFWFRFIMLLSYLYFRL